MPSATERGLREYLARFRESWEAGKAETGKSPFDWPKFEVEALSHKHFSPLSDTEWGAVLAELQRSGVCPIDETATREAVNVEALASGNFMQFGVITTPDRSKAAEWISRQFGLAERLEKLIPEIRDYLSDPPDQFGDDFYDPHQEVRGFDEATVSFVEHLRQFANTKLEQLGEYPEPPPNAKRKPEYDRWGAGLIEVWSKMLNQPIENGVALQRFMVACASPYGWLASTVPGTAERQARYFIDRYLAGEVRTWRPRRLAEMWVKGRHMQGSSPDK